MSHLSLYSRLIAADLRAQMQYRLSFALLTIGSFASLLLEFAVILVLFGRFPHLKGWSVGEVAFLYGLASVSLGLAEMVSGAFDHFHTLIVRGDFDRILTRPADPFVLLFGQEFQLRRLGRIGQGAVALAYAQTNLGLDWTLPKLLYLPVVFASGATFFVALFVIGATLCFWTTQTTEVMNIFTNGGAEMATYPLDIYAEWFRRFFIFVVPLAFVTYFPALFFLDRPDSFGLPAAFRFLAPVAALAFFGVARVIWTFGVKHYQSTGS
jgi:ABC-2 type transport system permease protein